MCCGHEGLGYEGWGTEATTRGKEEVASGEGMEQIA